MSSQGNAPGTATATDPILTIRPNGATDDSDECRQFGDGFKKE